MNTTRDYRKDLFEWAETSGLVHEVALELLKKNDGISNDAVLRILIENADDNTVRDTLLELVLGAH